MAKALIIVDMQNDFVTGSLENENAAKIIPFVKEKIESAVKDDWKIIFTRDTHYENYLETLEGKQLPIEHCMMGSEGWEIVPELQPYTERKNAVVVDKNTFGFSGWAPYLKGVDEVYMCGTVTSISVAANAVMIKSTLPYVSVNILAKGCADLNTRKQESALNVLDAQQCIIIEDEDEGNK